MTAVIIMAASFPAFHGNGSAAFAVTTHSSSLSRIQGNTLKALMVSLQFAQDAHHGLGADSGRHAFGC